MIFISISVMGKVVDVNSLSGSPCVKVNERAGKKGGRCS